MTENPTTEELAMNRAEEVDRLLRDCLYQATELSDPATPPKDAILVGGIVRNFGFHPGRVAQNKNAIRAVLTGLPEQFYAGNGGGWSFLNLCNDAAGEQWGEHPTMEALVVLGIAAGFVKYCLPREMWKVLPGGVPYITINLEPAPKEASP